MEKATLIRSVKVILSVSFLIIILILLTQHEEAAPPATAENFVTAMTISAQDTPVSFIYVAQTQSSHLVNIQARVSGFLDTRVYTEGDIVKRGDILFVMDKKPFEAQLAAAKAAVERQMAAHQTAKLNLARVQPLAKLNALSEKDLDDAIGSFETTLAAVAQANAQLETAELNLSYCTITAPLDGITSAARLQEGTYLNIADSQLTTVSALDPIWVNFSLSENEMQNFRDQVKRGSLRMPVDQEYIIKVIQVNGEIFPHTGKITFAEPYYNSQTGTFLIRATLANPDYTLRPNQFVRVQVEGAIRPNAILVPQKTVHQSAKGHYVWILTPDNTVDLQPVEVGDWQGENWFITEGLTAGDRIVVDGTMRLYPGAPVTIKNTIKAD